MGAPTPLQTLILVLTKQFCSLQWECKMQIKWHFRIVPHRSSTKQQRLDTSQHAVFPLSATISSYYSISRQSIGTADQVSDFFVSSEMIKEITARTLSPCHLIGTTTPA